LWYDKENLMMKIIMDQTGKIKKELVMEVGVWAVI